jgi:hypothetical protein
VAIWPARTYSIVMVREDPDVEELDVEELNSGGSSGDEGGA